MIFAVLYVWSLIALTLCYKTPVFLQLITLKDAGNISVWPDGVQVCKCPYPWAPAGFFPGVGNEGLEGRKSPSRVQGHFPVGSWCEAPRMMHKYFVHWGFRQHLQQRHTFQHFQGASALLAHALLAHACGRRCPYPRSLEYQANLLSLWVLNVAVIRIMKKKL